MSAALIEVTSEQEWNSLVQNSPQQHLLQSWGWGELKGRFGWRALRISARDSHGRAALAQVLIRRQMGLSVLYVPRGPIFSGDASLDSLLLAGLRRLAHASRAIFLRFEPNLLESAPETPEICSLLLRHGFESASPLQPRTTIQLDLQPMPEQLLSAMSKGHRADIKRAAKKGVSVRIGETESDLDAFYALMRETGERAGFGIHSRAYYRAAQELIGSADPGAARLLLGEIEERPVAAFLIFGWGSEAQYMYSASSQDGLRSGANHLLQWESIQWARERGCLRYDFWGIPDVLGDAALAEDPAERERLEEQAKSHPLSGVYRFKKGFGGQVVRYLPAYDQVYLRPAYWLWQRRRQSE